MSQRDSLPFDDGSLVLTDAGPETALIFFGGFKLPCFASFPLMEYETGSAALRAYYEPFLKFASKRGTGFVLCACTWRASAEWGAQLGYDSDGMVAVNRHAIDFVEELRANGPEAERPVAIEAPIGPRGDAYAPAPARRTRAEPSTERHPAGRVTALGLPSPRTVVPEQKVQSTRSSGAAGARTHRNGHAAVVAVIALRRPRHPRPVRGRRRRTT
jgi:hypothetical protein